jgi:exodeoxyribonuclease V beta subunit
LDLDVAEFARTLDRRWRRTSYSDITAAAHEARVSSESEEPELRDEPDTPVPVGPPEAALDLVAGAALATPTLLGELPVGTAAGTLVHQAFEATDFAAADLDAELERALESAPGRRAVALADVTATVAGLRAAIATPLGPALGGIALRDVPRADRLDELGFELPLAGGDQPRDAVTVAEIGRLLRSSLSRDDPFYAYAAHLDDPTLRQSVRGYLTGSLDLVLRLPDGRFAVLDYKTNWLADPDEPLTAWHYRPQALVAEMHQRHYGLQALLYLVALHRYLRWRLPRYEPARHLAGVAYLFVRGMTGPDTPQIDGAPCGVFAWQPAPGLVAALSELLDGGGQT